MRFELFFMRHVLGREAGMEGGGEGGCVGEGQGKGEMEAVRGGVG